MTNQMIPEPSQATIDQIEAILAGQGYEITHLDSESIKIRDLDSGIVIQAVLEENILFLSVTCVTVPAGKVTSEAMGKMLAADNGISTSAFQLYDTGNGQVAVTLNNFCKLQSMGDDDEDDILSCVEFLLADVVASKQLVGQDFA